MRWRLFNYFRSSTVEQDVSCNGQDIQQELNQLNRRVLEIREDSILLEELRQLNNSVSQIRSEISNTLYFYLIGMTIITATIVGLVTLYLQYKGKPSFSLYSIEFCIIGSLMFSGVVGVLFIQRISHLTQEKYEFIKAIRAVKAFLLERLEGQGFNCDLLNVGSVSGSDNRIPTYIRYLILPVVGFSVSIATYVLSGIISFLFASMFSFPDTWAIAISIFSSVLVFGICFFLLERHYR